MGRRCLFFFHLFGMLEGLLLCLGHSNPFGRQAYQKVVWGYFVFSRSVKLEAWFGGQVVAALSFGLLEGAFCILRV